VKRKLLSQPDEVRLRAQSGLVVCARQGPLVTEAV
jgi:hypothetical protein